MRKPFAILSLMLLGTLCVSSPSTALERSCDAVIYIVKIDPPETANTRVDLVKFSAKGRAALAKRAREEARDRALKCADWAKQNRFEFGIPDYCKPQSHVHHYDIENLKASIENAACSRDNNAKEKVGRWQARIAVSGGRGCDKRNDIMGYNINNTMCRLRVGWRHNKDFDGPNVDNMTLLKPDPALCAKACLDNDKCTAWTYVKPGVQAADAARCWLKSKVNFDLNNSCCVSATARK